METSQAREGLLNYIQLGVSDKYLGSNCGEVYSRSAGLEREGIAGIGCEDKEDFDDEWSLPHAEQCRSVITEEECWWSGLDQCGGMCEERGVWIM